MKFYVMKPIKPVLLLVFCFVFHGAFAQWNSKNYPGTSNSYVNYLGVAGMNTIIFTEGTSNIFASTNAGDNFTKTIVSGGFLWHLSVPSEKIAFYTKIVSNKVELYQSTNGGINWNNRIILVNDTNAFGAVGAPYKVLGMTDSFFVATGHLPDSTVIITVSTDGGTTWLRSDFGLKMKNFGFNVSNNFYKFGDTLILEYNDPNAIKSVPTYFFSYNNGNSWSQTNMPLFNVYPNLLWINSQLAIWQNRSNRPDISISYDGGKSFDSTYSTFKSSSISFLKMYKFGSSSKVLSFDNSGLYYSNDLGKTWIVQDQMRHTFLSFSTKGFGATITSSDLDHDDEVYTFGYFTGLSANHNSNTPLTFYPNPSHDLITFSTSIEKVEIYNAIGAIVLEGAGRELSILSLKSGIYFIKVNGTYLINKLIVY